MPCTSPPIFGKDVIIVAGDAEAISWHLRENLIILLLNFNSLSQDLTYKQEDSDRTCSKQEPKTQCTSALSGWPNRCQEMRGGNQAMEMAWQKDKMRQLPSFSEAHRAGESLDSKEDVVYMLGKSGLTEATSGQTLSTAFPTAPLGRDGKNKSSWCLKIWVYMGRELSFYFFFLQECFKEKLLFSTKKVKIYHTFIHWDPVQITVNWGCPRGHKQWPSLPLRSDAVTLTPLNSHEVSKHSSNKHHLGVCHGGEVLAHVACTPVHIGTQREKWCTYSRGLFLPVV